MPQLPPADDHVLANGRARPALSRRALLSGALGSLAALAACTALPPPVAPSLPADNQAGPGTAAAPAAPAVPAGTQAGAVPTCAVRPVIVPTTVPYPGYTKLEPSTGLHVTGEAYEVDLAGYSLKIGGKVDRPLSLTYEELRCLPKTEARVMLACPGFFVDEQTLAGPTLATVLALAGPQADATAVKLVSSEPYNQDFVLTDVLDARNFLAYEWEGQTLPRSHGFPLRGVFPGQAGSNWVKWVVEIQLL